MSSAKGFFHLITLYSVEKILQKCEQFSIKKIFLLHTDGTMDKNHKKKKICQHFLKNFFDKKQQFHVQIEVF